jgi:hypothetical protein
MVLVCKVEHPFWVKQDIIRYRFKSFWQGILFQKAFSKLYRPWDERSIDAWPLLDFSSTIFTYACRKPYEIEDKQMKQAKSSCMTRCEVDVPLWLLLIAFAAVADWLCSQLD